MKNSRNLEIDQMILDEAKLKIKKEYQGEERRRVTKQKMVDDLQDLIDSPFRNQGD